MSGKQRGAQQGVARRGRERTYRRSLLHNTQTRRAALTAPALQGAELDARNDVDHPPSVLDGGNQPASVVAYIEDDKSNSRCEENSKTAPFAKYAKSAAPKTSNLFATRLPPSEPLRGCWPPNVSATTKPLTTCAVSERACIAAKKNPALPMYARVLRQKVRKGLKMTNRVCLMCRHSTARDTSNILAFLRSSLLCCGCSHK
jgi:hypothetical protein